MKEYGYYVEEDITVCPKCAANPEYAGLLTVVEEEGYPDGYTCDDCNATIAGEGESEVA
jgi:hypothetical protein